MADFTPKFADLVRNFTSTVGTADFALGPVANGYASFASVLSVGDQFYYSCIGVDKPAEHEIGRGTLLSGNKVKREPINGTKTSFSSGTKAINLIAAAEWFGEAQGSVAAIPALQIRLDAANQDIAILESQVAGMSATAGGSGGSTSSGVQLVADRTAMSAIANGGTGVAFLEEAGREGLFGWDPSNLSAAISVDPAQAMTVAPASAPTGASGAWVRRNASAKDARWFGAKGDGASDDSIALQRWLDSGGRLSLPAAEFYSSTDLILRKNASIEGAGYGFDNRIAGYDNMPGARIRFAAGKGFKAQGQTTLTTVAAVNAAGSGAWTQEGCSFSTIRNLALIGASSGTVATGFTANVVIHLDSVHVLLFTGKGFDLSASSDTDDGNSEYGNLSTSSLRNCRAISNGSHGLHIRGRDANTCLIENFNAQLNGGWGILDESLLGNIYVKPHIATNTLGAAKAIGAVQNNSWLQPYVEVGSGSNCQLGGGNTWLGSNLDSVNAAPAERAGQFTWFQAITSKLRINWNTLTTFASRAAWPGGDYGQIGGLADRGLVLQGNGGATDIALYSSDGQLAGYVPGLTNGFRTPGNLVSDTMLTLNGNSVWPGLTGTVNGNARACVYAHAGLGLVFGGAGSTNDICLANKDGSAVMTVPTGTVNANFGGNLVVTGTVSGSNLLGTNTGDETATTVTNKLNAFTGDVTKAAGGTALTISANAVTYSKFQQVAASSLLGNPTGVPASVQGIALGSDHAFSGTTLQLGAFTGDIAKTAGGLATTIAANAVTYAKFQQVAASSLVGNPTGALANAQGITLAGGLAFSGTTLTAAGALTPISIAATGAVTSSSASGGVGYAAGAGGAVTQLTSKSTGVTLNKVSGQVTMNAAALAAAAIVEFTVTNSVVASTDTINLNLGAGAAPGSAYRYWISGVAAGSFKIAVENRSAASLSEALVLNFAVLKAVAA